MDVDAQAMEACAGSHRDSKMNTLVIQTAFIGDAILTLPLIQTLKRNYPQSSIDVVVVPRTAEVFLNHPSISEIIPYDKRGRDKGIKGFLRLYSKLRKKNYELIIVPHRSLRSALLTWLLRPKLSIGFDRSSGSWWFKKIVHYDSAAHEIERNLSLLNPLRISSDESILPRLHPSVQDGQVVDSIMDDFGLNKQASIIAIAPGTIWNTKRWPADRFAAACKQLSTTKCDAVVLLGGKEDYALCAEIMTISRSAKGFNAAGKLTLLQSAELIRRCKLLISNDSAPMHIAVAVGTPVIAIFGATVPEFGFAPRGPYDVIIEIKGLKCRPCSIHGGKHCPIKTFECMLAISPETVVNTAMPFLK